MGWLSDWKKRIKLTIDNTNVDSTLLDFPVLIKLSNSSGISSTDVTAIFDELTSNVNRKKIAVTTSNGTTQCYVEIERWDHANEKAELWAKGPSVSSAANTILYLYYDASQADNTTYVGDTLSTPAQSVWDSDFVGVWHMAQDPNGDVADTIKDSTSNANHGTPAGSMTTADLVDGKIGKAIDFDGSSDSLNLGDLSQVEGSDELTLENIIKATAFPSSGNYIIGKYGAYSTPAYDDRSFVISVFSDGSIHFGTVNTAGDARYIAQSSDTLSIGTYYYVAGVTKAGELQKIFIDDGEAAYSNQETYPAGQTIRANSEPAYISKYGGGTYHWQGPLDEIRVSTIARSTAWLKATYYSNWDDLISFGPIQVRCISGYVKEGIVPVNRQIYLHNRNTGELIASTTSSGVGGYFYCETTYSGAHYVVCLDDVAGASYNDLIYGNILPATISG